MDSLTHRESNFIDDKYIQLMKNKSGEDRLRIAFALRKLALKLAEASIKEKHPNISIARLKAELFKRIYGINFPA